MIEAIRKGWVLAALAGAIVFFAPIANAELETVEEEPEVVIVEEEVPAVVTDLPKAKKVFKKKKKKATKQAPRVIVIQQTAPKATANAETDEAAAAEAAEEPKPETFGQKLSKRIDAKLEADRKAREEEMRKAEAERQAKLLDRIDTALNAEDKPQEKQIEEPLYVQPAQQNVQPVRVVDDQSFTTLNGATEAKSEEPQAAGSGLSIAPNVGISNLNTESYDVDSGSAVGIALAYAINENVVFNFGYTYSQYEISLPQNGFAFNSFNSFYQNQFGFNNFLNNNLQELEFNQNVFDAGLRYLLFDSSSKLRPYIGGGVSYAVGYLNYKQKAIDTFAQDSFVRNSGALDDYEVTGFSGYIQAGAILNFSRTFGVAANFKYHTLISADEEQPIQNFGFVANNRLLNVNQMQTDKNSVAGTLTDASWTTLDLSLVLSF